MNRIISDTAEYGCYLFDHACRPLLEDFFKKVSKEVLGGKFSDSNEIDNQELIEINEIIRSHPIEIIGKKLRDSMTNMKKII
jgi:ketol-acid reductoisomerase